MTTYTKAEREFWEKCCSAPYVVLEGEGTRFQPTTHCHEEAEMCALTADAKLEEWRKRFGKQLTVEPTTPASCFSCRHWDERDTSERCRACAYGGNRVSMWERTDD